MAIATDYSRHPLDLSLEDVMPEGPGRGNYRRRPVLDLAADRPIVKPGVRPDDEFHVKRKKVVSRAALLAGLTALIDAALARADAFNSDEDDPDLVALSEYAGLTLSEYEAATMRANGLKWSEIAESQGVSATTASRAAARGFQKLREFILSC